MKIRIILLVSIFISGIALAQDSLNIRTVGLWPFGTGRAVVHTNIGGSEYAAMGSGGGVILLNMDTPSSPVKVSEIITPGYILNMEISGDRLFIADGYYGLRMVDISNPASPVEVGSYVNPDIYTYSVAVSDSFAYVLDRPLNIYDSSSLYVINMSDPANPIEIGNFKPEENFLLYDVALMGNYAIVVGTKCHILDISDPSNLIEVSSLWVSGRGIKILDSCAYLASPDGGLIIVDISDPYLPVEIGSCETPGYYSRGVDVSGNYAYLADYDKGLRIIDISDPSSPTEVGYYDTLGATHDVAVSGSYAYVANDYFGLQVMDVGNPAIPNVVGSYPTPYEIGKMKISGDYAYAIDVSALYVLDISDLSNIREVARYKGDLINPQAMELSGNHAYVIDQDWPNDSFKLYIFDITIPASPVMTANCVIPAAYNLCASGNYVYLAGSGSGLRIIDVSDPFTPSEVGNYDTPGSANDVVVSGDYAYVADGSSDLRIIDISDKSNPAAAGYCNIPSSAFCVEVLNDYAYIATFDSGLRVIDISDKSSPFEAGYYYNPDRTSWIFDLAASGNYAYLADMDNGLAIIDVSDPSNPMEVGLYKCPGIPGVYVTVSNGLIYFSWGNIGLHVYQGYGPAGVENDKTQNENGEIKRRDLKLRVYNDKIEYNIPGGGQTSLKVYNLLGQEVRTLINEFKSSGVYSLRWDGRNSNSRKVASGVYLVRLQTGEQAVTAKMLVVR